MVNKAEVNKFIGTSVRKLGLITLANLFLASCGTGVARAPGIETPVRLADNITEQLSNHSPLATYDTTATNKVDQRVIESEKTRGEFSSSVAIIGFDLSKDKPAPISSEILSYKNGSFVTFYDEEGKPTAEGLPAVLKLGVDVGTGDLTMLFKATIQNQDGTKSEVPFLTLFSNVSLDSLDQNLVARAEQGDQEAQMELSKYFNTANNIDEVVYSNLATRKGIDIKRSEFKDWGLRFTDFFKQLNPFYTIPVLAAGLTPTVPVPSPEPSPMVPPTPTENPSPMPLTAAELGINDPASALATAFTGVEKSVTHEANGGYSVQATSYSENTAGNGYDTTQEKYTIDKNSLSLTEDIPVVSATDSQGNKVTLLYDKSTGLFTKEFTNLSTNIESPTDFPYEARVAMMQSIRLEHADPFTTRLQGLQVLLVRSENTINGRVVYLRTDDASGTHSKATDYWLRVKMPDGSTYWVNPADVNDMDRRKIMMCAYGKDFTNPTQGQNPGLDKGIRAMLVSYMKKNRPIWGILTADGSFFNNFSLKSTMIPGSDGSDLNYLLSLFQPEKDLSFFPFVGTHFNQPEATVNVIESNVSSYDAKTGKFSNAPVDPSIEDLILPCATQ